MMTPKIQAMLDKVLEMESRTTPGPWKVMGKSDHIIGNSIQDAQEKNCRHHQWTHNTTDDNAQFIAAARSLMAPMVAVIKDSYKLKLVHKENCCTLSTDFVEDDCNCGLWDFVESRIKLLDELYRLFPEFNWLR